MKTFLQLQRETSAAQLAFLLTDIDTAHTFLDVAGTTKDPTTRDRNLGHAEVAYAAVFRLSERVRITPEEAADLQNRLGLLKQRMRSMVPPVIQGRVRQV